MPASRLLQPATAPAVAVALLATALPAHGGDAALCPAPPPLPEVNAPIPAEAGVIRAAADFAISRGPVVTLVGDAGIRRGERALGADRLRFHRRRGVIEARGDAVLITPGFVLHAARGKMDLDTGALSVEDARYRKPALPAQGRARRLSRNERGVTTIIEGTYSTCPAEAEAWHLAADRVKLYPRIRQGTARDVTLWFKGVPLFYSPWFRFPLGDARLTGFLAPRFGHSSSSGLEFSIPFYWNVAPNLDVTLTPHWLERRGTMLESELRWLGPAGYWQLNIEFLPDDDLTGEDRSFTHLQQHADFGAWNTRIDAAWVSDRDYFDDLGNALEVASQRFLRRRAQASWRSAAGRFRARIETYQVLDPTIDADDRPYRQLPQLTFVRDTVRALPPGYLEIDLGAELVRFERDDSVTGTRLRLVPAATWAIEAPGWFIRPRLAIDHTSYWLDRSAAPAASGPEHISRTLPILSLDTGLVFDRFGAAYHQTLEPRAFYVYIPEEEQSEIPLFDTGQFGFSFSRLFRERRFTGGDRIGDANRLTLALTSRLLSRETGRQLLRGSIGVIRYFDERDVTLSNTPRRENTSDVIAELQANPTPFWRAGLSVQWDPDTERISAGNAAVRYRGPDGGIANLAYRYRRGLQEQIDLSLAWPASPRWQFVAVRSYSLLNERNIETLIGVEYNSCCWQLRMVARQYISDDGAEQSSGIYFELVLKGLGSLGDETEALLEHAIVGY